MSQFESKQLLTDVKTKWFYIPEREVYSLVVESEKMNNDFNKPIEQ